MARRVHGARIAYQSRPSNVEGSGVSALTALERRLLVYDVRRMLPTRGSGMVSIAVPNRLGGVDHSDDRRCLVPLAAAEEVGYAPKPSGTAPATGESAG